MKVKWKVPRVRELQGKELGLLYYWECNVVAQKFASDTNRVEDNKECVPQPRNMNEMLRIKSANPFFENIIQYWYLDSPGEAFDVDLQQVESVVGVSDDFSDTPSRQHEWKSDRGLDDFDLVQDPPKNTNTTRNLTG